MRILGLFIVFMGVFYVQAMAIVPVNNDVIKEAQEYGKSKSAVEFTEFITPWMSYEERAFKLDQTTDRAYLYSPFLCFAADARDKVLKGQAVNFEDSNKVLLDYGGFLIFSVTLFGDNELFAGHLTATLKQDRKIISVHQAIVPSEPTKVNYDNRVLYSLQSYFYFKENEINIGKPVLLTVTNDQKQERKFYFDLAKIK